MAVIESLDTAEAIIDVAINFIDELTQANPGSVGSYWYLEICKEFQRSNHPPYGPPYNATLQTLMTDKNLLRRHLKPIIDQEPLSDPTYWAEVLDGLTI